jgi:diketogulonate reductase-like aldo/keto reductase
MSKNHAVQHGNSGSKNVRASKRSFGRSRFGGVCDCVFSSFNIYQIVSIALVVGILLQPDCPAIGVSAFTIVNQPNTHNIKRIVFGTAAISKAEKPLELLDEAYGKGFRRFDLARTYGGGESERIFGEWMKTRNIDRSSVGIITKGGMGKDKYGSPDRPMPTKEGLLREVATSLKALNTDVVDLYMFHRDDLRISAAEHVIWANELVESGKVKRWGVSNWSFERFREAH